MDASLSDAQILERIKKIVNEVLKVAPDAIVPASRYKEDLGADSLDTVSLLMALEEEFGQQIADDEALTLVSVQATLDFIRSKC